MLFFSGISVNTNIHNRSDEWDRAMQHLKSFAAQYPPNDVRTPTPKTNLRSTRTSLVGSRPLVRMTSETEVPDDHVPPLMMFRDLSILHHRLMDEGRTKDIKYVTWLCKAYEWALRIRRDAAVKAEVCTYVQYLVICHIEMAWIMGFIKHFDGRERFPNILPQKL
jgi:hypothetical protein